MIAESPASRLPQSDGRSFIVTTNATTGFGAYSYDGTGNITTIGSDGVTFGATTLKQRMETTVGASGQVNVAVNRQIFGRDLRARQYVDIATGVAHEGAHGLQGRANPELRNSNSRSVLMQQETDAYRAGGYIYQSIGFSDTHRAIWQVNGGWTPLLEQFAQQSVDAECADRGGCSP